MPPVSQAVLEDLPPDQCSIILNITATGNGPAGPAHRRRQLDLLKRLGPKVQPGYNIYRIDYSMHFMIGLITESGCKREIRMGLAQPVLNRQNVFLPSHRYCLVGDQIVRFASDAAREGITIALDCGFVRCMFSDENIRCLADLRADFGWRCSPILDIDVDGNVFHCFPLASKYTSRVDDRATAADLREAFFRKTEPYRHTGIFKECSSCLYKQDQTCPGGCLANIIHRFSTQSFRFSL
jgi:radical SAM protein with 4Fe4S-binding SPASM domain